MVTRGSGSLGIDPRRCIKPTVFMIVSELQFVDPALLRRGINAIIASTRRTPCDSLDPRIKSLNYLNHILAKQEANRAGVHEAILLNHQGRIAEGSADNVFLVKNGTVLTPPTSEGALDGITRSVVMDLAAELHIDCRESPLTPFDIWSADECFVTGTGAELIPVAKVNQHSLKQCPGVVFTRLYCAFQELVLAPERWS